MRKIITTIAICLLLAVLVISNIVYNSSSVYAIEKTDNTSGDRFRVVQNINNQLDLDKYKSQVRNEFKKYEKLEELKPILERSILTITFNDSISVKSFINIIKNYNMNILDFEVKFLNTEGVWITGCFKKPDESLILKEADIFIKNSKEEELNYEGITSARVICNLSMNKIEKIENEKDVFFVDIVDSVIRLKNKDLEFKSKIAVPDLAWEIEAIRKK